MMMYPPSPRRVQALTLTLAAADNAAEHLISAAVPPQTIKVADRTVVMSDVAENIKIAQEQDSLLEHFDLEAPCARLRHAPLAAENNRTESHVPISISGCGGNVEYPMTQLDTLRALERSVESATNAGFSVDYISRDDARSWLRRSVARIIGLRWSKSADDGHYEPPTADVEVHTTIDGVNVVWANGYFININERFGRSTPAKNKLPYGYYTFGIFYKRCHDFEPLLYRVPINEPIYLDKP